ncbi:hypothetical protein PI125_g21287 [Phytophthora idaei]|nr:hypothetical protein PI125_g21287 [Phytophthora idaei]
MDPDSMTTAVSEEIDGLSCGACESATYAGPELEPPDVVDVVEHGFPCRDERWLSRDGVVEHGLPQAVEHGFPRMVEREPPADKDETLVERGLPQAVEDRLPRRVELELLGTEDVVEHGCAQVVERKSSYVVEQDLSGEVDAVELRIPHPDADLLVGVASLLTWSSLGSHRLPRRVLRDRFVIVADVSRVDLARLLSRQRRLRPM